MSLELNPFIFSCLSKGGENMEADPINVLLYDIREMRKRLDEMEKALLMLKARLVEEEEGESPEEIEALEREALESGKEWEELKRELGL